VAIARQTAVGGTWMVGARLISRVIDLGTMLVLAHLLRPKDFGLVAIAMTLIYVVEAALELPVSQALVRLSNVEPEHYDTAFTLSLGRGLALGAIVCMISWPFAHFYGDSKLLFLVWMLSLAPAARGLVSPRLADFSRNIDFSPDFMMELGGKVAAFSVAVVIALTTRSYWAIAAATIISPVASTTISYIIAPYRPRLSLAAVSSFSGFLGWMTAAQVVGAFNWQTDRLLLGKLTSKAELGLFSAANDASNIPVMALLGPILRPLLSAFSLLKEDAERIAESYQRSATAMVTAGLPILVAEALLAHPTVRLLLGQQWVGSARLLSWLAMSTVPTLFALPMGPLVMSFGKTQVFLKRNLVEVCIKLPLVIVGAIKYGFMGVIFARCVSEAVTILFCMTVVRRMIGLSIRRQLLGPWRSIVSAAAMALVLKATVPYLATTVALSSLAAGLLLIAALGATVYLGLLWFLWNVSGSPAGLEAMVASALTDWMRRSRRLAISEAS
jgi:O-antigen/teichoic acid export membrane protein